MSRILFGVGQVIYRDNSLELFISYFIYLLIGILFLMVLWKGIEKKFGYSPKDLALRAVDTFTPRSKETASGTSGLAMTEENSRGRFNSLPHGQEDDGILLKIEDAIVGFFESILDRFCPNFERMFPTEDSRYTNFILFMYLTLFPPVLVAALKVYERNFGQTIKESTALLLLFLMLGFALFSLLVNVYLFIKSGTLRFVVKLVVGMVLGGLVTAIFGPLVIVLIPAAIIVNRKRIAVLKHYISFLLYPLAATLSTPLCIFLGLALMVGSHGRSGAGIGTLFMFAMGYIAPVCIFHEFLRREQKKGRPFYDTVRLLFAVPIVFILCCTSLLTLTHIGGLSDHSLFGDPGVDYLDMSTAYASPTDFGGLGVDSAPDTFGSVLDDFSSVQGPDLGAHDFGATPDTGHHDFGMAQDVGQSFSNSQAAPFASHDVPTQHSTGAEFTQFHHGDMGHTDVVSAHEMQNGHITLKDSMGHTVQTATTDNVTGKMTFHDTMGHQTGTATTDTVGGDTHFQNAMGQHQGTLTDQGNILNQLGMSEGNIKTTASGEVVIQDSLGHTRAIIKNGTILDAQNQTIGHIRK
ncbi:MAG: hypothetical protein K5982_03170 [Selenomonadaceae bacterium]|nr:hypothetical protein [Selenomonadaceae bacterium]